MVDVLAPPASNIYEGGVIRAALRSQPWAAELQRESNVALAQAVREQFCEEDVLKQTRAEQYNRDLQDIISSIQHSPTKDGKHVQAVEKLSPHCRQRPLLCPAFAAM